MPIVAEKTRAFQTYGAAVALMRRLFDAPGAINAESAHQVAAVADGMLRLLEDDDQALLALACRSTPDNYIYSHCANVAVLSLRLGCGLGWQRDKLLRLGIAALVHDLGMRPYLKQVSQNRRLSAKEYRAMQAHVIETAGLLGQFELGPEQWRPVADIILLEQERQNHNLKSQARRFPAEIRLCSQIIGICDAYESISHPRGWRKAALPHDAVRTIVKLSQATYERAVIHLFLSRVTPYPPGSYVLLSDETLARVVRVDPEYPTLPSVLPLTTADGQRQESAGVLDLKAERMIALKSPIDEMAVEIADQALWAQIEADRWWVAS